MKFLERGKEELRAGLEKGLEDELSGESRDFPDSRGFVHSIGYTIGTLQARYPRAYSFILAASMMKF